jgi:hypothetical protein
MTEAVCAMDELFADTFAVLKYKLTDMKKSSKSQSEIQFMSENSSFCLKHEEGFDKLLNLRKLRKESVEKMLRSQVIGTNIEKIIQNHYDRSNFVCNQHLQYAMKQLNTQNLTAERRLRELVYEIVGEYGKSVIRAQRRQLHLRLSNRIDQVVSVSQLRWKLFLHRLIFEALSPLEGTLLTQQLTQSSSFFSILNPSQHSEEYSYITSSLSRLTNQLDATSRDESSSSQVTDSHSPIIVCCVVKLDPKYDGSVLLKKKGDQGGGTSRPTTVNRPTRGAISEYSQAPNINSSIPFLVADNLQTLKELLSTLREGLGPPKDLTYPNPTGAARPRSTSTTTNRPSSGNLNRGLSKSFSSQRVVPSCPSLCSLLSNHSIEWLKPCSYHPISSQVLSLHFKSFQSQTLNQFDQFTRQYVTQYMTHSYSQNLYFCLEERLLSGISADDLILSQSTTSGSTSGPGSSSGNTTPKHNDHIALQAIKYLQVSYSSSLH